MVCEKPDLQKQIPFNSEEFKFRFFVFSAIIGLFVFPIIQANILFQDDRLRAFAGCVSFGTNGRILGEFLFYLLHLYFRIADTGSLFQIVAIFILASSITFFSLTFRYNRLSAFLALPFIACTPFFLQNISFRYDSLTMPLSIALAILGVCAQMKGKYLLSILYVFGIFNFYQVSFTSFLGLSCLAGFILLFQEGLTSSFCYIAKSLGIGLTSLILYKIWLFIFALLPINGFKLSGWSEAHGYMNYHILHVLQNLLIGLKYCFIDFNHGSVFISLTIGVLLSVVVFIAKLVLKAKEQNGAERMLFLFWGIALFVLSICSIIGPMALLDNMVADQRTMIGAGAFLSASATLLIGRNLKFQGFKMIPACVLGFMIFEVILGAFVYATAVKEENDFENQLVDQMILDTYSLTKGKTTFIHYENLSIDQFSPNTDTARWLQPWIIPTLQNNINFSAYIAPEVWHERRAPSSMKVARNLLNGKPTPSCQYEHIIQRPYYALYQTGDQVLIDFSSKCTK